METVQKSETMWDLIEPEVAHDALSDFSAFRALNYVVRIFNRDKDEIVFPEPDGDLLLTPVQLAEHLRKHNPLAINVKLCFKGGPPGYQDWYEGSLLTYMVDCLFSSIAGGDELTVADFLRRTAA